MSSMSNLLPRTRNGPKISSREITSPLQRSALTKKNRYCRISKILVFILISAPLVLFFYSIQFFDDGHDNIVKNQLRQQPEPQHEKQKQKHHNNNKMEEKKSHQVSKSNLGQEIITIPTIPSNIPANTQPCQIPFYRYAKANADTTQNWWWTGEVPPGYDSGHESLFLGIITSCAAEGAFHSKNGCKPSLRDITTTVQTVTPPLLGDHTFEWFDMMHALEYSASQDGRFHMLELGAGWGKWCVDGVFLALRLGLPPDRIRAIGLEAQDLHCQYGKEHIEINVRRVLDEMGHGDVEDPMMASMICGAAAEKDGIIEFPKMRDDMTIAKRYGIGVQMLLDGKRNQVDEVVSIPSYGVCSLLSRDDFRIDNSDNTIVDFMSLDVQSYEHAILSPTKEILDCLDTKLRVLHISLHRVEENDARPITEAMVGKLGWKLVRYFPLFTKMNTQYGTVDFVDGILTFVNPKLAQGLAEKMYHKANVYLGPYTNYRGKKMHETVAKDWSRGDYITDIIPFSRV